jgi:hypothetical protein
MKEIQLREKAMRYRLYAYQILIVFCDREIQ